jgi:lipopolysaccharide transport system permease protein
MTPQSDQWDWEISARRSWWNINLKEWWFYRHLLGRLVRREFLLNYQQTVLGPLWILLQPVLTLIVYVLVFGRIIGIPTGGAPPVLFYLSGIILWNFFSETFINTAFTFNQNAQLFSKVYFPRLIIPLSAMASHGLRFVVQAILLLVLWLYYRFYVGVPLQTGIAILSIPLVLLLTGVIAFSAGIIFSVFTARYRDLMNVVHLGVRLLMFITPVVYPAAVIPEKAGWIAAWNPLMAPFECFRWSVLGEGNFTAWQSGYSIVFALILFFAALSLFSRQGDKLMDVV